MKHSGAQNPRGAIGLFSEPVASLLQAHHLLGATSHARHFGQLLITHYTFAENTYAKEKAAPNSCL